MVVANTTSGATRHFDLRTPVDVDALLELIRAREVTALAIQLDTSRHVLTLPRRFKRHAVTFGAEPVLNDGTSPIGERVYVQAEGVRVTLTATYSSGIVRCDLDKTGRLLYTPHNRAGV